MAMLIKDAIAQLVQQAATNAMQAGALPQAPLPDVTIERPRLPEHGDYASNLPMRLQRAVGGKPIDIAEKIRAHVPDSPMIGAAEVAPPGFLNLRLSEQWLAEQVNAILVAGESFATVQENLGDRVQIEFVSANPTGLLHVGNGRGAIFGSVLASVLEATGHQVEREYYVNDAGTQAGVFTETIYARYQQLFSRAVEVPEGGYPDPYLIEIAQRLRDSHDDDFLRPEGEPAPPELGKLGMDLILGEIRTDLERLGVHYDVWFHEHSLYEPGGQYERTTADLRRRGFIAEKEGAVWFTSSELGEDKDNVLVRSSGAPTYFASDIAYHYNKFVERGFDRVIDVWGADHHGHISRLKTAVSAFDIDSERLQILLYQLVMLFKGGQAARLSKRRGETYPLRQLADEVGVDACRFFFLQRSADSTLDFDIELATEQSDKNPVFYVQYAHARICSILQRAAEQGLSPEGGDVALLTQPAELALIRKMLQLPEVLDLISRTLEPHHLPYYALDLANTFHAFYTDVAVVTRQVTRNKVKQTIEVAPEHSRARLRLIAAARVALARTLHLMGMSAPERMERRARDEDAEDGEDE
jgi:arginyl-tRNA synthetase